MKRSTDPKPEKPRAFLLGVATAELLSDVHAEIERIEAERLDEQREGAPQRSESEE